jgi:hypothetical protein
MGCINSSGSNVFNLHASRAQRAGAIIFSPWWLAYGAGGAEHGALCMDRSGGLRGGFSGSGRDGSWLVGGLAGARAAPTVIDMKFLFRQRDGPKEGRGK